MLPLAGCEVSIVHTQPSSAGDIVLRTEHDVLTRFNPVLSTVLHSAIAGPTLANKLLSLTEQYRAVWLSRYQPGGMQSSLLHLTSLLNTLLPSHQHSQP